MNIREPHSCLLTRTERTQLCLDRDKAGMRCFYPRIEIGMVARRRKRWGVRRAGGGGPTGRSYRSFFWLAREAANLHIRWVVDPYQPKP